MSFFPREMSEGSSQGTQFPPLSVYMPHFLPWRLDWSFTEYTCVCASSAYVTVNPFSSQAFSSAWYPFIPSPKSIVTHSVFQYPKSSTTPLLPSRSALVSPIAGVSTATASSTVTVRRILVRVTFMF